MFWAGGIHECVEVQASELQGVADDQIDYLGPVAGFLCRRQLVNACIVVGVLDGWIGIQGHGML